jgi:hypothetical protein
LIGVEHWLNFYKKHEHYRRLGVLMGRYYDAAGKETSHRSARVAYEEEDTCV